MLVYHSFSYDHPYSSNTRSLYESAFPEEERPPFSILLGMKNNTLYMVVENDTFIGLIDTAKYQDQLYIFFLAIEPSMQSKGYGTQILKDIVAKNPEKRIYLSIETMDPKADNYSQRLQRLAFYERNGFFRTGESFDEFGVTYDLLTYNHASLSAKEHYKLMASLNEEEFARRFYPQAFE